jgi:hypothetical protein
LTSLNGEQAAEDKGMVKNHWMWWVLTASDQIQFSFDVVNIASNEAQYVGSSRPGSDPDYANSKGESEGAVYSGVGEHWEASRR